MEEYNLKNPHCRNISKIQYKKLQKQKKLIHLTHKYMIAHFPVLTTNSCRKKYEKV